MEQEKSNEALKAVIKNHWEDETCGIRYAVSQSRSDYFNEIEKARYRLEPYIMKLAEFPTSKGKTVLEIGVGAGTDFSNWTKHAGKAYGIDLTRRGIDLTTERLQIAGVDPARYDLRTADVENLPFSNDMFDLVWSWGVLHVPPRPDVAFAQVYRVLKPGGKLKAMVYDWFSWTGLMLWVYHYLLRGRPFVSLRTAVYEHLESPGTNTYTPSEFRKLLEGVGYRNIRIYKEIGPGDLLDIEPSKRYRSPIMKLIWKLYPSWLVKLLGPRFGLYVCVECNKPV